MKNLISWFATAGLVLLSGCSKEEPAAGASASAKPASAPTVSPTAGMKLVTVDLTPAGAAYKGLSITGPGTPKLLNRPSAEVQWLRSSTDPKLPEFTVDINPGKLDVAAMKKWVTNWAQGFSTPGKLVYVTDTPSELAYTVDLVVEGKKEVAYGYGVEVKVGAETFSCSSPNFEERDLAMLKEVCRSLAKK